MIFTPLALGRGGLALPNRIWLPAMVTWRASEDGHVTESVREIYKRYAAGGCGMIVLEAIGVRDVKSGPLLRLGDDRFVPGLRSLVSEMRGLGRGLVIPQLIDFLKIATRKPTRTYLEDAVRRRHLPETVLDLGDGEFDARLDEFLPDARQRRDYLYGYRQTIEDLDLSEIRALPDIFAAAGRRARACGFDGIELHFAHAYTMAQFLSVLNRRRDAYGGSLANRLRLPLEVIEAVRGAVGPEFVVGCRYLGSEDVETEDGRIVGNTVEDAAAIGVALAQAGLDFLSISRGGKFEDAKQPPVGETMYPYTGHSGHTCIPRRKGEPWGLNVPLATAIRSAVRAAGFTTPVITSGRIWTFEQAESILVDERADAVGMARAILADPDLPRKWLAGAGASIRECVFCPYCEKEDQAHRTVTCTLWPKDPHNPRLRVTPETWRCP